MVRGIIYHWKVGVDSPFVGAKSNCAAKLGRVWWFADPHNTHNGDPSSKLIAEAGAVNGTEAGMLFYGEAPATEKSMLWATAEVWIEGAGKNRWVGESQYLLFVKNETSRVDDRRPHLEAVGIDEHVLKSRHVAYRDE